MGMFLRRNCPIPTPTLPLKGREFSQRKINTNRIRIRVARQQAIENMPRGLLNILYTPTPRRIARYEKLMT
ncbi:MAG: hypothetical protein A2075_03135 [Geobacteraceae bacterium GWC2_58_44]|nr:MAG: hypothetical protein A2075_03135 [Geobacteraceae bacterium GWC2_58_44]HBG04090.1 hypothetical protein [Geobacter sp.]